MKTRQRWTNQDNQVPSRPRQTKSRLFPFLILAFACFATWDRASADARCDCESVVAQCRAQIEEVPTTSAGSRFRIKADTDHCAMVEWSADGNDGQTTVWDDGEEISRVAPRKPGGSLRVLSCRVCKDNLKDRTTDCRTFRIGDRCASDTEAASAAAARAHVVKCTTIAHQIMAMQQEQNQIPEDGATDQQTARWDELQQNILSLAHQNKDCENIKEVNE